MRPQQPPPAGPDPIQAGRLLNELVNQHGERIHQGAARAQARAERARQLEDLGCHPELALMLAEAIARLSELETPQGTTYRVVREDTRFKLVRYVDELPGRGAFGRGLWIAKDELPTPPPNKLLIVVAAAAGR